MQGLKLLSAVAAAIILATGASGECAGTNPLIVKAVALENFNCDPVVSLEDSNRILVENYATKFLKALKVVFLYD